jgi:hypothetical protein
LVAWSRQAFYITIGQKAYCLAKENDGSILSEEKTGQQKAEADENAEQRGDAKGKYRVYQPRSTLKDGKDSDDPG